MITIVLVDDQPAVRQGLRMRLALEPDVQIVGETDNGVTSLDLVAALDPDVVVMDVGMPVLDGLSATARLRAAGVRSRIVILTIHDDRETRARAHEVGAEWFVGKHTEIDCLPGVIREVARSEGRCVERVQDG